MTPIAAAIDAWRVSLQGRDYAEHGRRLRKLLWEPVAKHLSGARTVLVSPDGALTRLSLAALPGEQPDTHLIEEVSVAILPVPQLLPNLLARAAQANAVGLLLVGDVDYRGSPGTAAASAARRSAAGQGTGRLPPFDVLAASRAEVAAIRDSFELRFAKGKVETLRRQGATEATFRSKAPGCRWLHLATHAFFAPAGLKSALSEGESPEPWSREPKGYHPGLLSGLALAGANAPPEPDGDDGILTALEVAGLDLSQVELAVLSACETGLGEVAGGEGVLGPQRAFQVAGARTTVTSLWKVPDVATQLLMQRFYENLWDKAMPKLEALRQAQLWLMKDGRARGIRVEGESEEAASRRMPPHFWAAFVLSGDWR